MIRKATQKDIPAIVNLSLEALSIDAYHQLVPSRERTFITVQECVNSAMNFSMVSEHDGEIIGGLGALVMPLMMYERNQAVVVLWYCRHPGDGVKLLRQFKRWMSERPMIKQVVYTEERNADPRVGQTFRRVMGSQDALPTHVMTR